MDYITHIKEAFLNLISSKMRSFLAILGILVGTGSVVALVSSGQLATNNALAQFKTLGTNLLAVSMMPATSSSDDESGGKKKTSTISFTMDDLPTVMSASNQVVSLAPYTNSYQSTYIAGIDKSAAVIGATEELMDIAKIQLSEGRAITSFDKNSMFCMIGSKLAASIRAKGVKPLGSQILIGSNMFTIIGVAKPWKSNFFFYADIDNGIVIPIEVSTLVNSNTKISNILIKLIEDPDLDAVKAQVKSKLTLLLPDTNITYKDPQQIMDVVGKQRKTFTLLLSSIGGISLLVGGIGVMNIMLVSVIERRKEIGVRMAIGAKQSDILKMFIIESIVLTVFGGILGIVIGVLISFVLAESSGWGYVFFAQPPALGFTVSVIVGILSGFYPALKASQLNPSEII